MVKGGSGKAKSKGIGLGLPNGRAYGFKAGSSKFMRGENGFTHSDGTPLHRKDKALLRRMGLIR